jgi:hypothetical protein
MKFNIIILFILCNCFAACGQLFDVEEEYVGRFALPNEEYHLEVVNVATGATSSDVMQFRKVATNGSYYVINNLENVDSLVSCQVVGDTLLVIVRGKYWMKYLDNDSFRFSWQTLWTPEKFPARRRTQKMKKN